MTLHVAAFYQFAPIAEPKQLRAELKEFLLARDVYGTILVAPEGLNGTVSGTPQAIEETLARLRAIDGFAGLEAKISQCEFHPFARTKVKLKREIVPFGLPCKPAETTAPQLDAKAWNELLANPDTLVLDTRNSYEVALGTFDGAVDPHIRHFRHLPSYIKSELGENKERPIATFCTGGIRCEKLTSWMMEQGFTNVFQLKGGILKYLEDCPKEESRWQGNCFVFDERVGVDHALAPAKEENSDS